MLIKFVDFKSNNIWYVSDDGSDDNDCHSASAPCRNLQTVLNNATDGADIYVTFDTLSLYGYHKYINKSMHGPISPVPLSTTHSLV